MEARGKRGDKREEHSSLEGDWDAAFLGISNKLHAKKEGGFKFEHEREWATSNSREAATEDLKDLVQALEGKLKVPTLSAEQMQTLSSRAGARWDIELSNFRRGTKTLTSGVSFQRLARGKAITPARRLVPARTEVAQQMMTYDWEFQWRASSRREDRPKLLATRKFSNKAASYREAEADARKQADKRWQEDFKAWPYNQWLSYRLAGTTRD
jgi:hypothetical protein